ncbi:RagB/SusD family nutrient uptake outer membrane protein [Flavobacterium phragmitis]|uniref:RagB/SusD domain-containing protein n=1 Tax=Flavobacterium phragmitis TaxID=739143 RepID=A0A1I1X168_9FLAO|nr:RagB/SusD family nutrient uptake outer membrane protein [Flavobacterium phragmitis]SFE01072.1 RagB/SusD domain-containing protein [Flavobacterium phragmitis]
MKNIFNTSKMLLLFLVLSVSGCSDYIELENKNDIPLKGFYNSESELNYALSGCYSTLRAPIAYEWMLSEIRSDNTFMNLTATTIPQNLQIYSNDIFEAPAFDSFIESYWGTTYQSIRSINALLEGLKTSYNPNSGTIEYGPFTITMTEAERKRIAGEASFMRAYHYFNLVRLYGGVFLIDKVVTSEESLRIPRSTVSDIYKFILADLKNASENCVSAKYGNTTDAQKAVQGKATVWAAKALLAKVYLTLGQKADALQLLTDVINNSGHSILTGATGYSNVFSSTNEMNAEIVFAIRFKSGALGYGSSLSNLFATNNTSVASQTKLAQPVGTRGSYNNPTAELYNSYAANDIRRDYSIKVYKPTATSLSSTWTYWAAKHNIATTVANDSELDWPVLRYSDVLLMYCEAVGANNPTTLGYLNQVHTRAGLTALTSTNVNTQALYEKAVADERRWEFALENQRWFDLLRFSTTMPTINAKAVMNNHFAVMQPFYAQYDGAYTTAQLQQKTADPKFDLLPIPNSEIVTNTINPIQQNPGY